MHQFSGILTEDFIRQELGQSKQSALGAKKKDELALESHGVGDTLSAQDNLKIIEDMLRDYDTKVKPFKG